MFFHGRHKAPVKKSVESWQSPDPVVSPTGLSRIATSTPPNRMFCGGISAVARVAPLRQYRSVMGGDLLEGALGAPS